MRQSNRDPGGRYQHNRAKDFIKQSVDFTHVPSSLFIKGNSSC